MNRNFTSLDIDDETYQKILELSTQADIHADEKNFTEAIETYHKAFNLIPEQFESYEASTWLLTAIGEAYLFTKSYEKARHALQAR